MGQMLDAALAYAARGWYVFPIVAGGKTPVTTHGFKDATTDEAQIRRWWTDNEYNIGLATGPDSDVFVIDVDPRNGGELIPELGEPHVKTGSGGWHYYFYWPTGIAKLRHSYGMGVDIKGWGGYVLLPPSNNGNGDYEWVNESEPYKPTPELVVKIVARLEEDRPGDRYNEETDWMDLLGPEGWTVHSTDPSGVIFLTRPGKDEGISASIGYVGTNNDGFFAWTTSTPFEAGRAYDKFGAYAVLHHKGNLSDAAASLQGPRVGLKATVTGSAPADITPPPPMVEDGYSFTEAVNSSHFIGRFIAYGNKVTDAASEYHEACALSMLSVVTAGVKIALAPYPDGLQTNLFTVLVGASSTSRKSTAQSIAKYMLGKALGEAVLPDRMTGEAAIGLLAIKSGQPVIWMPDEMGVTFQQIYEREFMRPLEELLLTLYSGQEYKYQTVGSGLRHIYGLHMTVLGAATPESFSGAGTRIASGGLLPRFGVVYPGHQPPPRPLSGDAAIADRDALVSSLQRVMVTVANSKEKQVTVSPEALAYIASTDAEFSRFVQTARLSTATYKVAALIALADARWVVEVGDAKSAVTVVRRWAEGAMRLRPFVSRSTSDMAFQSLVQDVLVEMKAAGLGGKYTPRETIARLLKLERRQLDRVRDTLEDSGYIAVLTQDGSEMWLVP